MSLNSAQLEFQSSDQMPSRALLSSIHCMVYVTGFADVLKEKKTARWDVEKRKGKFG